MTLLLNPSIHYWADGVARLYIVPAHLSVHNKRPFYDSKAHSFRTPLPITNSKSRKNNDKAHSTLAHTLPRQYAAQKNAWKCKRSMTSTISTYFSRTTGAWFPLANSGDAHFSAAQTPYLLEHRWKFVGASFAAHNKIVCKYILQPDCSRQVHLNFQN